MDGKHSVAGRYCPAQVPELAGSAAFTSRDSRAKVTNVSFEAVYRAERSRLIWYLMSMGADQHQADDAVQAAFARAYAGWETIRQPRPWLYKVALRELYRAEARVRKREMPAGDALPEAAGPLDSGDIAVLNEEEEMVRAFRWREDMIMASQVPTRPLAADLGDIDPGLAGIDGHADSETLGFLAAIDGPAGVGKTTVAALAGALLTEHGVSAVVTRQPSDSAMGKLARASTHDLRGLALSFLMAADRYHHQEHVIIPALQAGQVVVCDRYVTTALVLDQLDGADPEFIWSIYRYLRWPDLAVILTGDPALCRARATDRGLYSRFHEGGAGAATSEAALYARSASLLVSYGYPVEVLAIGDRTAEQVGDAVLELIQDRMTTTSAQ